MIEKEDQLTSLHKHSGGSVAFGDKRCREIIGTGKTKLNSSITVREVSLVHELGFSLLSVAQLCDQGNNKTIFTSHDCYVKDRETKNIILRGVRFKDVYIVDKDFKPKEVLYFASIADETELWHRRLGHANLRLIHRLHANEHVCGLLIKAKVVSPNQSKS